MILVGKKKFRSKDGKLIYHQLFCTRPFSDFDLRYSLEVAGNMLETVWVDDKTYDKVTSKDFGKEIILINDYVGGRSTVVDVKIG